jgi:hypothetical protein
MRHDYDVRNDVSKPCRLAWPLVQFDLPKEVIFALDLAAWQAKDFGTTIE